MAVRLPRLTIPLLGRVVIALAAVGVLPFLVSAYQLRSGEAAMVGQAQKTHLVAVLATADRIASHVQLLQSLAAATAANRVVADDPASAAAEELLAGLLRARSDIVAAGIYLDQADPVNATRPRSEPIRLARRSDFRQTIDGALTAIDNRPLAIVPSGEEPWVRIRATVTERPELFVLLLARLSALDDIIRAEEIGDEAVMALTDRANQVLLGGFDDIESVSPLLLAAAGRTASGVDRFTLANGLKLIAAHAAVGGTPWFVLSRQPLRAAASAAAQQRKVARRAFALVLAVTALITLWAQRGIVAPIRRLVQAQRKLSGSTGGRSGGDEIAQLENAFAELEDNLHDREALSKVFLGRYQIVEVVGVGAMGTVFRGWDPRLERAVALKTVKVGRVGDHAELSAQLVREAVTLARLDHPNIVTVYDVESQGDKAFLAMELVDGVSLERYLWRRKRLPIEQVVTIGQALLAALATAHDHGVVHHDVKPANILLKDDGAVKVTDFGISELVTSVQRDRSVICGTPGYLAPEALQGERYTPASDLFAVGVVLYQCLTGERPFDGVNPREILVATLSGVVEPPSRLRSDVPPVLEEVVLALLAEDPARRPASAAAARAVLTSIELENGGLEPENESLRRHPALGWPARRDEEPDDEDRFHTCLVPTHRLGGAR